MASTQLVPHRLYHYTSERGLAGILADGAINPSLAATNPHDVRHGEGQYLSDIVPGTMSPAQLSRAFLGAPFQGRRFIHYVRIDVRGLPVMAARSGVYVLAGTRPLDITGRIWSTGRA